MSAEAATRATRLPRNGVMRNVSYLVGGQVTTWAIAFLWTVVVPRKIGPTGMGQLVIAWSATAILVVVVGLGARTLVVTQIARNATSAGHQVAAAIAGRLILFVPGAGLMALYILFAQFDRYQVLVLVVSTIALPLVLATDVLQAAFQGLERMQYLAYLDVFQKTVVTVGGVVLVLMGFHALGIVVLSAVAWVLVFGTSLYWARRHFDIPWRIEPAEVVSLAVKSLPFWATSMISTFYLWIDSVILALMASAGEVGWYGVATKLIATLLFIPVIISTATLARLTATHMEGHESFRRMLTPIVESTLVISLPIAAGTVALSGPALDLLYGPAYGASAPVLAILALAIPPIYLNIVVNQSLVASNRQVVWTKVMVVSTVINVLLNLVAIPTARDGWHNAGLGAAWSLLATEVMMAGAGLYLMRGSIDLAAAGRVMRAALAALLMGLVVHAALPLGLFVQVAMGVVIFGGLAVVLRLIRPQELALGRLYAGQLRNRLVGSQAG